MTKIVVKIDGMHCGMCEAFINDAIRNSIPVKKVSSSYKKGETVILTNADIKDEKLREMIKKTGYEIVSISREPYKKRSFLERLKTD